jgi:hypothetical protein
MNQVFREVGGRARPEMQEYWGILVFSFKAEQTVRQ